MRVGHLASVCALLFFLIVVSNPAYSAVQTFDTIMPQYPGTAAMVVIKLTVEDGGFVVPFQGEDREFCYKYCYDVELWDDLPISGQILDIRVDNCNETPYVAEDGKINVKPISESAGIPLRAASFGGPSSTSIIRWVAHDVDAGPQLQEGHSYCFFTDAAPVAGNIQFAGYRFGPGGPTFIGFDVSYIVPCGEICEDIPPPPPPPGDPGDEICEHNFNIAQVYPAIAPIPLPPTDDFPFPPLGCWNGAQLIPFEDFAVPGVLSLQTSLDNMLDVEAFSSGECCPGGTVDLTGVRLVKTVPGSAKFPGCYQPYQVTQLGRENIRTWWALNYTQPGTTFCLTIEGICNTPGTPGDPPKPKFCPRHNNGPFRRNPFAPCTCDDNGNGNPGSPPTATPFEEVWCWTVTANPETFRLLLGLMHFPAMGLSEVPCFTDEAVFLALLECSDDLKDAIDAFQNNPNNSTRGAAIDAVLNCEALILANTLFVLSLEEAHEVIGFPNSNFAPAGAGIVDTCENPCSCKLLADLEYIWNANNLGN